MAHRSLAQSPRLLLVVVLAVLSGGLVLVSPARGVTFYSSVSAGSHHACALEAAQFDGLNWTFDPGVVCWGGNATSWPPSGARFGSIDAGGYQTCGLLLGGGHLVCFGEGGHGGTFSSVSAGVFYTCGVKTDQHVVCWGNDRDGQSSPPEGTYKSVSAGEYHTCGVKTDEHVVCWGQNDRGQASPPEGKFLSVSAGLYHTCGVRTDHTVACWGYNAKWPNCCAALAPEGHFKSVTAGGFHTCGIRTDDRASCWGSNGQGQARPPGTPYGSDSGHQPGWQRAPGGDKFVSVSAGPFYTCGVRLADYQVVCWGLNRDGVATPPA
jgi:alpha-tubulin suppressor-like RCC1 family protein